MTGIDTGVTGQAYRPEVDGLRAMAVVLVILFHAGVSGWSGGFLGVDIFFVISGYLITQIILRESESGTFSFARFYERRARRILPALFVMAAVAALAGWVLFIPSDLTSLSKALLGLATFSANFVFLKEVNYFAPAADTQPLLHIWSLAIEEQFYVVFPVLVLVLQRANRRLLPPAIAVLTLGSLIYGEWVLHGSAAVSFYSPLSRGFELGIGALLAATRLPDPRRLPGDGLSFIGIAMLGYCVLTYNANTPFPGLHAVLPCAGTALLVFGMRAPGSMVARALSLRPLVVTGQASYSLYLWHLPFIVFGTYFVFDHTGVARLAGAALSVPAGFLSWRFIEKPFRGPAGMWDRRTIFTRALCGCGAFALLGTLGLALHGAPWRVDPMTAAIDRSGRQPACKPIPHKQGRACFLGSRKPRPAFVLWGDSHGAMYRGTLDRMARAGGVMGFDVTHTSTPPLIYSTDRPNGPANWRRRADTTLELIDRVRPKAVLLAGRWQQYAQPVTPRSVRSGRSIDNFRRALGQTVAWLRARGIAVYFVEDVPEARGPVASITARAHRIGARVDLERTTAEYRVATHNVSVVVHELERKGLIRIISPQDKLCGPRTCRVLDAGGLPLYFDRAHLTPRGADYVSGAFAEAMREIAKP